MAMVKSYRKRMSLRELEKPENDTKRFAFLKAWKNIKALPSTNPNSFWAIATYHGEPFKDRAVTVPPSTNVWNGYCQHGNVLFPTWHRFYVLRLEQALQAVCPDDDVAMHYWDQTSDESLNHGLPRLLVDESVIIDDQGNRIQNPLRNFTLPEIIPTYSDDDVYGKEIGYATVRYPQSGIKTPSSAQKIAEEHNEKLVLDNVDLTKALQTNVTTALNTKSFFGKGAIKNLYLDCLSQGNYNIFSNTQSAGQFAESASLEEPHNQIHLATGGYTYIKDTDMDRGNAGIIQGANGDMGANEVAAFDPVFFFHHCNVDRMFWVWQKKFGHTKSFHIDWIIDKQLDQGAYPIQQGPTPHQGKGQQLTMDTVLYPFQKATGQSVSSKDCIDVEGQLGYTYSIGSLDREIWPTIPTKSFQRKQVSTFEEVKAKFQTALRSKGKQGIFFDITGISKDNWKTSAKHEILIAEPGVLTPGEHGVSRSLRRFLLKVENIKNDDYPGSYMVRAYRKLVDGKAILIGQYGVLSRWNRKTCANCQLHSYSSATFEIPAEFYPKQDEVANLDDYIVTINHKDPHKGEEKIQQIVLQSKDETKLITRFFLFLSEE